MSERARSCRSLQAPPPRRLGQGRAIPGIPSPRIRRMRSKPTPDGSTLRHVRGGTGYRFGHGDARGRRPRRAPPTSSPAARSGVGLTHSATAILLELFADLVVEPVLEALLAGGTSAERDRSAGTRRTVSASVIVQNICPSCVERHVTPSGHSICAGFRSRCRAPARAWSPPRPRNEASCRPPGWSGRGRSRRRPRNTAVKSITAPSSVVPVHENSSPSPRPAVGLPRRRRRVRPQPDLFGRLPLDQLRPPPLVRFGRGARSCTDRATRAASQRNRRTADAERERHGPIRPHGLGRLCTDQPSAAAGRRSRSGHQPIPFEYSYHPLGVDALDPQPAARCLTCSPRSGSSSCSSQTQRGLRRHRTGAGVAPRGAVAATGAGVENRRPAGRLARDPNRFLATIQIGITLAGFLASAAAAVSLAEPLEAPLGFLGGAAEPVAIVVVTLLLAYVTLVFGELAPKRVAMQRAERGGCWLLVPWRSCRCSPARSSGRCRGRPTWPCGLMGGDPITGTARRSPRRRSETWSPARRPSPPSRS